MHWLLAAVTPWHVLIMDSLTWDIGMRRTEISNVFSYIQHLVTKFHLPERHQKLIYKVLKVPQQPILSNNCGIYVYFFLKHFLEEIEIYEDDPNRYCEIVHNWFPDEVAEQKRTDQRRYLQALISMEKYKTTK